MQETWRQLYESEWPCSQVYPLSKILVIYVCRNGGERPGRIYHVSDPDRRKRRSRRRHQTIEWFWGPFLQCLSKCGSPKCLWSKKKVATLCTGWRIKFCAQKCTFSFESPSPFCFYMLQAIKNWRQEGLGMRLESECCKVMLASFPGSPKHKINTRGEPSPTVPKCVSKL